MASSDNIDRLASVPVDIIHSTIVDDTSSQQIINKSLKTLEIAQVLYPHKEQVAPIQTTPTIEVRVVTKSPADPKEIIEAIQRLPTEKIVYDDETITDVALMLDTVLVDEFKPDVNTFVAEAANAKYLDDDPAIIQAVSLESRTATIELPHDSNPILDSLIDHLEEYVNTPFHELSTAISIKVEQLDFETAREVEVTFLSIVALEQLITENEDRSVHIDSETYEKLETLYIELAELLGIDINVDDMEFEQFQELIQKIIPDLITADYKPLLFDSGTHEYLTDDTAYPQQFNRALINTAESFSSWIGRYTLQLARI